MPLDRHLMTRAGTETPSHCDSVSTAVQYIQANSGDIPEGGIQPDVSGGIPEGALLTRTYTRFYFFSSVVPGRNHLY